MEIELCVWECKCKIRDSLAETVVENSYFCIWKFIFSPGPPFVSCKSVWQSNVKLKHIDILYVW